MINSDTPCRFTCMKSRNETIEKAASIETVLSRLGPRNDLAHWLNSKALDTLFLSTQGLDVAYIQFAIEPGGYNIMHN